MVRAVMTCCKIHKQTVASGRVLNEDLQFIASSSSSQVTVMVTLGVFQAFLLNQ